MFDSKEYSKWYYQTHKKELLFGMKKYRLEHKYKIKEDNKRWRKTPKGKISTKTSHYLRVKNIGFNPLNYPFWCCDSHHLDNINVIFIPNKIHHLIDHRRDDEVQMKKINMVAWDFLEAGAY